MKKKVFLITIISIIISALIISRTKLYFPLRSYLIMYPYSYIHKTESLMKKYNVNFNIPGGSSTDKKDWYPFVMIFNDDNSFSRYIGKDLSLTILYNFGHFQTNYGSSSYYNPESSYFSSFYGGYIVRNNSDPDEKFGFHKNGQINIEESLSIPKYDQTRLVLSSLGCPLNERVFDATIDNVQYNVTYLGIKDWVKIDSTIKTNSPVHRFKKDNLGYLQYGEPIEKYYKGDDFPTISLKGRIYAKYIEKYKMTFYIYILAPNEKTIEECDKEILSKSKIK